MSHIEEIDNVLLGVKIGIMTLFFLKLIKQKIEKVLINQILEKGTRLEFIILLLKFLNGRTG